MFLIKNKSLLLRNIINESNCKSFDISLREKINIKL